jgi:hypothetical protein
MALYRATGGSDAGERLFFAWRAQAPDFDERKTRARWAHWHRSPPTQLGAGSLFHAADEADQQRLGSFLDISRPCASRSGLPGGGDAMGGEQPAEDSTGTVQTEQSEPTESVRASQDAPKGNGADPEIEEIRATYRAAAAKATAAAAQVRADEPPDLSVLRLNRRPPPRCPIEIFGDRWAGWITDAAAASVAPIDFVVGPLLSAASSLIGNARWAQGPGMSSAWKEPPVLWIASVGDSGDGKTPAANMVMRDVVTEIDRRLYGDYPMRRKDWEIACDRAKQEEIFWRANNAAAVKTGGPGAAIPRPANSIPPPEPVRPSWLLHDITIEKVALSFAGAPKGLLLYRDELMGFLAGMTVYNESGRHFWTESYNGGRHIVARVKYDDPIIIEHLTCALCGGVQPELLADWFKGKPDDGFASRWWWLWPEPLDFDLPQVVCDISFALAAFDRLRELEMFPLASQLEPLPVPLVTTAAPALRTFARQMQAEQRKTAGLLRSAYGKARGQALRLALVLEFMWWAAGGQALTAGPPGVISERAFAYACGCISDYVLPMAARSYGDAALPRVQRLAAVLAQWIVEERPSEVPVRLLYRTVRLPGLTTANAVHATCHELIEANWLLEGARAHGKDRRRATYPINPKLWAALDESGL